MKLQIGIFILLFFPVLSSISQEVHLRELDNSQSLIITDVATSDGYFYFTAIAYPSSLDSSSALLIKTNSFLDMEWTKRYKIYHNDEFNSIVALDDGNFMIGGTARQDFVLNEGADYFIVDEDGVVLEHTVFPLSYDDKLIEISDRGEDGKDLFIRKGVSNQPSKFVQLDESNNLMAAYEIMSGSSGVNVDDVVMDDDGNYWFVGSKFNGELGYSVGVMGKIEGNTLAWIKHIDPGYSLTLSRIYYYEHTDDILIGGSVIPGSGIIQLRDLFLMSMDDLGNTNWSKRIYRSEELDEGLSGITEVSGIMYLSTWYIQNDGTGGRGMLIPFKANGSLDDAGNMVIGSADDPFNYQSLLGVDNDYTVILSGTAEDLFTRRVHSINPYSIGYCGLSEEDVFDELIEVEITSQLSALEPIEIVTENLTYEITDIELNTSPLCDQTWSVGEFDHQIEISCYPNPTSDQILIESSSREGLIQIFDSNGRLMKEFQLNSDRTSLNCSDFPSGIYLIKQSSDREIGSVRFEVIR